MNSAVGFTHNGSGSGQRTLSSACPLDGCVSGVKPNKAVELSSTAFARTSLRLLARLTASVRCHADSGKLTKRREPMTELQVTTTSGISLVLDAATVQGF